jgi:hypothetical protein
MIELLKGLSEYGAIGLVSVVSLGWAWRLYRDMKTTQAESRKEVHALQTEHRQEMEALRERYITKAETWMSKYHELSKAQNEVLDAIERRYGR